MAQNICQEAALGSFEAVKAGVDETAELVNRADEQGHPPLHWAALNNHLDILQYLLSNGSELDAVNTEGASALHWAVVRNALPCIEALLRAGANKHAKDSRGYQYGHTAALYHLVLRWNCDFCSLDNEKRTPLHWAAYKGFHDLVRLLLVLGCDPSAQDVEGCNCLHWAAIRGNSEAATILIQAGGLPLLRAIDNMGNTPASCASNGNHNMLAHHFDQEERRLVHLGMPKNRWIKFIKGMHFAPVIWIACFLTVGVFFKKVLGNTASSIPPKPWMVICSLVILVTFGIGLVLMALVNMSDPGYVPRRGERTKKSQRYSALLDTENLDCPALWAGNWEQLCVTCKIVRPLRSKHDPFSNRCIEVFDHFCPWVGNSIGKGNRHLFIAFILAMAVALILGYAVSLGRLAQTGLFDWGPHQRQYLQSTSASATMKWAILWLSCNIPLVLPVLGLAGAQLSQVAQNITTNELQNWPRYKHFRSGGVSGAATSFRNPFRKTMLKNCHEVWCPGDYPTLPAFLQSETMERMRQQLNKISGNERASESA